MSRSATVGEPITFEVVDTSNHTYWYRVRDGRYAPPLDEWDRPVGSGRTYLSVERYQVLKETSKGVWLGSTRYGKRFVLRDSRKRFACPTVAEALTSFLARKKRQLGILRAQQDQVETAIHMAQRRLDRGEFNTDADWI